MDKLKLQDLNVDGKRVLLRVDFNVPLDKEGAITDDTRIRESLPSIQYIIDHGGRIILMSHLGRPKNGPDPHLSLKPCAAILSKLLKRFIKMADDCIGSQVKQQVNKLKKGEILLLENLRFYPAEENPNSDLTFSKQLASLGDVYVNDAFGAAHREHSSVVNTATYFPDRAAAGFLMQKEVEALELLLLNPKRPFYAIIGGSKISSKMGVLRTLADKVDAIFIGGGMANPFLKIQGMNIGKSLCESESLPLAEAFLKQCAQKNLSLYFPIDLMIADAFSNEAQHKVVSTSQGVLDGWQALDIGPQTLFKWQDILKKASTVFWNGPLGVFEFPHFSQGTKEIAKTLADLPAVTIVGGGDSVAAINNLHLSSHFSHISTGGGASLEFIEKGTLPGIDALS